MISIRNVSKSFGAVMAVRDISFEVAQGQHFILLGTSGCGKTTTLRMINRLIETSAGEIWVDGHNITGQSPEHLRRSMGYVLQRNSLFPHYTVAQNMSIVPQLLGWDKHRIGSRIEALADKLHLPQQYLYKYPHQLSGGEAQRVNLARALAADPSILLMDEPFSALDTITRAAIRKEFQELEELKKKTLIMVTHDVQEAFEMGDVICLMDKGTILQMGTPAELLFTPANDFVRNFLSDAFLQLSFTITRLQDLWQDIEPEALPESTPCIALQGTDTLSKAMGQIKDKNDKAIRIAIRHANNTEQKQVSWEGLLNAFSKYQTKR
jgi:osmoprotectant transport system ATP-binding protein